MNVLENVDRCTASYKQLFFMSTCMMLYIISKVIALTVLKDFIQHTLVTADKALALLVLHRK